MRIMHIHKSLEMIALWIILAQVFLVQWLNLTFYYTLIIDCALMLYLVVFVFGKQKKGSIILAALFFCAVVFVQCCYKFNDAVFLRNFHPVLCSFLIMLFFGACSSKQRIMTLCFSDLFYVVNTYMILNIPVLLLEWKGVVFLAGRHPADVVNTFKPDLMSGLFGFNGTPMLAMFSCFFFIYNLWYYRHVLRKKYKAFFLLYYLAMLAFYLFISIANDNKGFYIEFAISCGIFYFSIQGNLKRFLGIIRSGLKIIAAFAVVVGVLFFVYTRYQPFREVVDLAIERFLTGISSTNNTVGGSERFAIINYFFKSGHNKAVGSGISTMLWRQQDAFGFLHFGQNDLGSFLLLGGTSFVAVLLVCFFLITGAINTIHIVSLMEALYLVVLLIYTQPYTTTSIMISFMMFVSLCSLETASCPLESMSHRR